MWREVPPRDPLYLFKPQDEDLRSEYESYTALNEAMPVFSLGIVTARDDLTIAWTKEAAWKTVQEFASMAPEEARRHYELGPDAQDWQVRLAQADLRHSGLKRDNLCRVFYRHLTGDGRTIRAAPVDSTVGHGAK
jgi:hypothetical protein